VRNHFPETAELAEAAADAVLEDLGMPGEEIFAGVSTTIGRVRRLVAELATFYERGTEWWTIRQRDPALRQAWASQEARYEERRGELVRAAIRPLDVDPVAIAVTGVAVETIYFSLRAAGQASDAAAATVLDVLVPWLEERLAEADRGSVQPFPGERTRSRHGADR
jgi:hypothetical protein